YAAKPKGQRFYVPLPTQVRFIRGDRGTYLSHAAYDETCYFGVGCDIRFKGYEPFFRDMEDLILSEGGRPHWGKVFYRNPTHLYPDWPKYLGIRAKLDPSGKFMNEYMNRLVLGYPF
ncbi:MAG TPA: D-arabinono-1,4-lactone oxidase, partial [Bdellovibrionota bacterium]|nr:D-arabinono-1,4-lactone oxidase [Bdellovibrionota bacterium]